MGNLFGEIPGDFVVCRGIAPDDLNVDGGGQAEIQDLIGNVSGLKKEHDVGELLVQALAQAVYILGGRAVVAIFERDQDIAVTGSDHGAVPESEIEAAIGNADVVDNRVDLTGGNNLADFALNVGENDLGLFDARASGGLSVQAHLTGIHRREEVAANQRGKPQG